MERETSTSRGWREVDAAANLTSHARYLQTVSSLEQVQAFKRRSIDLLEIPLGAQVLDVGCGVGDEVRLMAERVGKDGRAVGIDSSAVMVAEARKRTEGLDLPAEFYVGDIYRLDYPDDTFDGCRAERVLMHLDDPQRALNEMVRVAKPGGHVVVFEPDWETTVLDLPDRALVRKIVHLFDQMNRNPWIGRQLYRHFHRAELVDLVVEPGWVLLTDPILARTILNLDARVTYGRENSLLSSAEAAAWSEQFEASAASGHFFAAQGGFLVAGRKPAT